MNRALQGDVLLGKCEVRVREVLSPRRGRTAGPGQA